MNWLKLTARERDVVVAERVMGWKWYRCEYIGRSHCSEAGKIRFNFLIDPKSPDWIYTEADISQAKPDQITNKWMPHYSTDISAAWLVVERMREMGFGLSIFTVSPLSSMMHGCIALFDVQIYPMRYDPSNKLNAHCDTASEAICLAALRAMGVEG